MTVAALIAVFLFASPAMRIIQRVRQIANEFVLASVALNERTIEFLQGLRLVRTFARNDYAIANVDDVLMESVSANRRGLIWQATITPVMELLTTIGVATFLVGGYLLLGDDSKNTLPSLIAFLFVLNRLMTRMATINNVIANVNSYIPFVQRISDILRTDDKNYIESGRQRFQGLRDRMEFKNVSLRYVENEEMALNHTSFTVPSGSMVAFVGESGAGKSTIFNLLLRLYDPTSGQILVDGLDLRELDLKRWREHIGTVSQDAFIFNASIRDNIAFGKLDATQEQIIAAARAAHAHDFIIESAEGYETVIGERGHRLSGGQRQRIAIARAIVRNPEILILDEATSALDSYSERLIQAALDELRSERTVLVIAHRLSTITMADQIFVLDQGKLIEQGTHEELLALNGRYTYLWQIQSKSEQMPTEKK
jgi:ABC-type multidrug transport system fused ATPase/permease subunit